VLLPVAGPARDRADVTTSHVAAQIFGTWVWPFEALSVLLLVALVAAFAVSRMTSSEVDDVDPAELVEATPPTAPAGERSEHEVEERVTTRGGAS
jgi:NADH-quinone oxidoreductase subunit J